MPTATTQMQYKGLNRRAQFALTVLLKHVASGCQECCEYIDMLRDDVPIKTNELCRYGRRIVDGAVAAIVAAGMYNNGGLQPCIAATPNSTATHTLPDPLGLPR